MPPPHKSINLKSHVDKLEGHWQPQQILNLNNSHSVKVASIQGSFIWHSHPETDELFYCVSGGPFNIELNTSAQSPEEADAAGVTEVVELKVGDMFCVPKAMQHRPVAEVETGIMIIEKVGTVNTGEREGHQMTSYVDEK